jgi:hypothetical protein
MSIDPPPPSPTLRGMLGRHLSFMLCQDLPSITPLSCASFQSKVPPTLRGTTCRGGGGGIDNNNHLQGGQLKEGTCGPLTCHPPHSSRGEGGGGTASLFDSPAAPCDDALGALHRSDKGHEGRIISLPVGGQQVLDPAEGVPQGGGGRRARGRPHCICCALRRRWCSSVFAWWVGPPPSLPPPPPARRGASFCCWRTEAVSGVSGV